jgi:hypothetical protein
MQRQCTSIAEAKQRKKSAHAGDTTDTRAA